MAENSVDADRSFVPLFWLEKIAAFVLAAHLESIGWKKVRLSVRPSEAQARAITGGVDWARNLRGAATLGRPFTSKQERMALDTEELTVEARSDLAASVPSVLKELVERGRLDMDPDRPDTAYRYDGLWHDDGGNIDLVALDGERMLVVELKGATSSKGRVNQTAASKSTREVVERIAQWAAEGIGDQHGLLLPDDRGLGTRGAFVRTLLDTWPSSMPDDARCPIFLISQKGDITDSTVASLRAGAGT